MIPGKNALEFGADGKIPAMGCAVEAGALIDPMILSQVNDSLPGPVRNLNYDPRK